MSIKIALSIRMSKIFCEFDSDSEISPNDARNLFQDFISKIVDAYGFKKHHSLNTVLDSFYDSSSQDLTIYSVEGHAFVEKCNLLDGVKFRPEGSEGEITLPKVSTIIDENFSRAAFELRRAIQYPYYTALHSYLAVEAVRKSFAGDDRDPAWSRMRDSLRISERPLKKLAEVAKEMRHGGGLPQSWPDRQFALQVGYEVVHRYQYWLETGRPMQLEFPELVLSGN